MSSDARPSISLMSSKVQTFPPCPLLGFLWWINDSDTRQCTWCWTNRRSICGRLLFSPLQRKFRATSYNQARLLMPRYFHFSDSTRTLRHRSWKIVKSFFLEIYVEINKFFCTLPLVFVKCVLTEMKFLYGYLFINKWLRVILRGPVVYSSRKCTSLKFNANIY